MITSILIVGVFSGNSISNYLWRRSALIHTTEEITVCNLFQCHINFKRKKTPMIKCTENNIHIIWIRHYLIYLFYCGLLNFLLINMLILCTLICFRTYLVLSYNKVYFQSNLLLYIFFTCFKSNSS